MYCILGFATHFENMTTIWACPPVTFFYHSQTSVRAAQPHAQQLPREDLTDQDMEDPARAVEKLVDQKVMEVVSDQEKPIYIVCWNPQFKKHRKNCECCPGHYLSTSVY